MMLQQKSRIYIVFIQLHLMYIYTYGERGKYNDR